VWIGSQATRRTLSQMMSSCCYIIRSENPFSHNAGLFLWSSHILLISVKPNTTGLHGCLCHWLNFFKVLFYECFPPFPPPACVPHLPRSAESMWLQHNQSCFQRLDCIYQSAKAKRPDCFPEHDQMTARHWLWKCLRLSCHTRGVETIHSRVSFCRGLTGTHLIVKYQ